MNGECIGENHFWNGEELVKGETCFCGKVTYQEFLEQGEAEVENQKPNPADMTYAEYNEYLSNVENVLTVAIHKAVLEIAAPFGVGLSMDMSLLNVTEIGSPSNKFVIGGVQIRKHFT